MRFLPPEVVLRLRHPTRRLFATSGTVIMIQLGYRVFAINWVLPVFWLLLIIPFYV